LLRESWVTFTSEASAERVMEKTAMSGTAVTSPLPETEIVLGSGTVRSYNRTRGQGLYGYGTRKNRQYQARWQDL